METGSRSLVPGRQSCPLRRHVEDNFGCATPLRGSRYAFTCAAVIIAAIVVTMTMMMIMVMIEDDDGDDGDGDVGDVGHDGHDGHHDDNGGLLVVMTRLVLC